MLRHVLEITLEAAITRCGRLNAFKPADYVAQTTRTRRRNLFNDPIRGISSRLSLSLNRRTSARIKVRHTRARSSPTWEPLRGMIPCVRDIYTVHVGAPCSDPVLRYAAPFLTYMYARVSRLCHSTRIHAIIYVARAQSKFLQSIWMRILCDNNKFSLEQRRCRRGVELEVTISIGKSRCVKQPPLR